MVGARGLLRTSDWKKEQSSVISRTVLLSYSFLLAKGSLTSVWSRRRRPLGPSSEAGVERGDPGGAGGGKRGPHGGGSKCSKLGRGSPVLPALEDVNVGGGGALPQPVGGGRRQAGLLQRLGAKLVQRWERRGRDGRRWYSWWRWIGLGVGGGHGGEARVPGAKRRGGAAVVADEVVTLTLLLLLLLLLDVLPYLGKRDEEDGSVFHCGGKAYRLKLRSAYLCDVAVGPVVGRRGPGDGGPPQGRGTWPRKGRPEI